MARGETLVVGLTGGIGSGKSRVTDLLGELGAAVECSDRIVRELQAPGSPALTEIAQAQSAMEASEVVQRVFNARVAEMRAQFAMVYQLSHAWK